MSAVLPQAPQAYRMLAATALHRGDRPYQQDQVQILRHARVKDCLLAVLADGMGGKSGGRKAADQVALTARQLFDRHVPAKDHPADLLRQLVLESHLMIKLTAITAEEEPHSTVAAFLLGPGLACDVVHAGDSRVYHFRGADLVSRTLDDSYVQRLIDEGKINEEQANTHPQGNLLTGCLGTQDEPPVTLHHIDAVLPGDTLMCCSDGLWHYFTPREMGMYVNSFAPRDAGEMMVTRARQRANGHGDNLSLAMVKIEQIP
ncbi:MAG: serine/threonine protein phosphatase [Burkholderiales bacterium RIFCSPHIGHO2_12_FULL_69_20]|nr:MAG: serine/threonine protein phosphatase [Burkholderiales bacterium RIFCSPHIGHO2_12_FULL_69_20]